MLRGVQNGKEVISKKPRLPNVEARSERLDANCLGGSLSSGEENTGGGLRICADHFRRRHSNVVESHDWFKRQPEISSGFASPTRRKKADVLWGAAVPIKSLEKLPRAAGGIPGRHNDCSPWTQYPRHGFEHRHRVGDVFDNINRANHVECSTNVVKRFSDHRDAIQTRDFSGAAGRLHSKFPVFIAKLAKQFPRVAADVQYVAAVAKSSDEGAHQLLIVPTGCGSPDVRRRCLVKPHVFAIRKDWMSECQITGVALEKIPARKAGGKKVSREVAALRQDAAVTNMVASALSAGRHQISMPRMALMP